MAVKKMGKRASSSAAPEARSADGSSLILDNYVQFFVGVISNKLLRVCAKVYPTKFGVSSNEWRVLSMLASEPHITATRICEVIGFDKAAVSRSIHILDQRGCLTSTAVDDHNRARLLALTAAGRRLHDAIMTVALEREERLLQGVSSADRRRLLEILRSMHRNAQTILDDTAVSAAKK